VESRESRELVWSTAYGTLWFDLFLFLTGVNLIVAVINRIPIRPGQWPFVVTHFSIVLLLTGAWISATFGYAGRMVISEGGRESQLFLDASEIHTRWYVDDDASGARAATVDAAFLLPQGQSLAGRLLQEPTEGRPELRIAEYLPDGEVAVELREGGRSGVPGVEFRLGSPEQEVRDWLLAGDPRFGRKDLGPLEVEFRVVDSGEALVGVEEVAAASDASVLISVDPEGVPVRIPVPASVGREVPCGRGVVARVGRYLLRARMVEGKLVDVASAAINPAAVVEIRVGERTEVHTVFANFSNFDAVHGRDPERPLVGRVALDANFDAVHGRDPERPLVGRVALDASGVMVKPRLAVLMGPDGQLRLQLTTPRYRSHPVPLRVGGVVALSGLGLEFELERLLKSVRSEMIVKASPDGRPTGRAYVRLEANWKDERGSLWLARGGATGEWTPAAGGRLEASFGPRTRPLPFSVALEEFELLRYPGSGRPAEYRSVVEVEPAATDLPARRAVISMNRPLDVAGFRLFQSSYQLGRDGGPDTTVLSVSYDPGVPVVYVSFVLIILGIAWGLRGLRRKAEQRARATHDGTLAAPGPMEENRGWAILTGGRVKPG
jgi:hypothetical protein